MKLTIFTINKVEKIDDYFLEKKDRSFILT